MTAVEDTSIDEIKSFIQDSLQDKILSCYAYLRINRFDATKLVSTYPEKWLRSYITNKYFKVDPVVIRACKKLTPFSWSITEYQNDMIFKQAGSYRLHEGVCFTAYDNEGGLAILSICNQGAEDDFLRKTSREEEKIQMLLLKCFDMDILSESDDANGHYLTDRESEILKWVSLGKTYWEISRICSISERTVRFHLNNAMNKLGANTIKFALTKAIQMRLV